jgi:hypothetical protein
MVPSYFPCVAVVKGKKDLRDCLQSGKVCNEHGVQNPLIVRLDLCFFVWLMKPWLWEKRRLCRCTMLTPTLKDNQKCSGTLNELDKPEPLPPAVSFDTDQPHAESGFLPSCS